MRGVVLSVHAHTYALVFFFAVATTDMKSKEQSLHLYRHIFLVLCLIYSRDIGWLYQIPLASSITSIITSIEHVYKNHA